MHTWRHAAHEFGEYQAFPGCLDDAQASGVPKMSASSQHPIGTMETCFLAADERYFADRLFHYLDRLPGARVLQAMVAHVIYK